MGDNLNREYLETGTTPFNFNNVTGSGDSASGGSGGSGMECMQLRAQPGPFHYLISEQAKSLVALQELQNEVGALLEFRDLVIETFPNLRSKMAPSMPAVARREWEPGVRVRRKIAAPGDSTRAKPQPSVQDSGFSTETSCGKDAHSSASASRSRPLEDELWALLDVIQRKGVRLRDDAELLRAELNERPDDTAEESFARALSADQCSCTESRRLRSERDELLARASQLEAAALAARHTPSPRTPASRTPLGRLDRVLDTPAHPPRVPTPDTKKFAAILLESNPVELQRQLLTSTVHTQVLLERLKRAAAQRTALLDKLERARDDNDDLKFQLEEKTIELEGARAVVRQLGNRQKTPTGDEPGRERDHSSMRDMEPVTIPDEPSEESRITETPKRTRPSRIPLHTAPKGSRQPARRDSAGNSVGPRSRSGESPARPPSAHSVRSVTSVRSRYSASSTTARKDPAKKTSAVPVRRNTGSAPPQTENKRHRQVSTNTEDVGGSFHDSLNFVTTRRESEANELIAEYLARTDRLVDNKLFSRMTHCRTRPLPADIHLRLAYESPQNLALELCKSILYENASSIDIKTLKSLNSHGDSKQYSEDSLWNGKPQQYFESMKYSVDTEEGTVNPTRAYENDSLAL